MNPEPSPQTPAPGVVRYYSFLPRGGGLLEDVLSGLALPQKSIPPKYFYDEQGCRLFEAICELPEYYLTRTETAILRGNIAEIAQFVGPEAELIEFGSGVQAKTRILIQALQRCKRSSTFRSTSRSIRCVLRQASLRPAFPSSISSASAPTIRSLSRCPSS